MEVDKQLFLSILNNLCLFFLRSCLSPGYTLSTTLLQIVTFFADPDFRHKPSKQKITHLHTIVKNFTCKTCGHSYDKPNPTIVDYTEVMPR